MLLLNAGEVVSSDRLVEALWSESQLDGTKALSVAVSRLRKVLEPERSSGGMHGWSSRVRPATR
jgi:DNA-binding winged helix-turn-helix (wHTH) protein